MQNVSMDGIHQNIRLWSGLSNMARLEITTHIGCPINCMDCPQELLRSQYKGNLMMDFEAYKAAIDKVPYYVRIDFSGMCEPFVNPHCADMILYAAQAGHPLALYTTLQGATEEDYEKLKDVKYEVTTIHIPDCDGRSTFKITDEYLQLLAKWPCDNYSCHGRIDPRVEPYLQPDKYLITFMHDRAGNLDTQEHVRFDPHATVTCVNCGTALNHNVLLPDGTVLMCCMDYGMTERFGNLFTQSYNEVLSSETAQVARAKMWKQDCLCKKCVNARI